jgi:hypothetical protein
VRVADGDDVFRRATARSDGAILVRDEVGSKDCRAETRWHETAFRNVAASLAEITGLSPRAA